MINDFKCAETIGFASLKKRDAIFHIQRSRMAQRFHPEWHFHDSVYKKGAFALVAFYFPVCICKSSARFLTAPELCCISRKGIDFFARLLVYRD